jgi:hypothetical protein
MELMASSKITKKKGSTHSLEFLVVLEGNYIPGTLATNKPPGKGPRKSSASQNAPSE